MQIQFENAKTGKKVCSINGIALHSKYDPEKEAERYVQLEKEKCSFPPSLVVVIEPALSYCASFFKIAFPNAIFTCIRMCREFSQTDALWDKIIHAENKTPEALSEELFSAFGEEMLCAAIFTAWPPSAQVFKTKTECAWLAIKQAVQKSRDVLGTREYFSVRWFKNMIRFCAMLNEQYYVEHQAKKNVLITASGFSLESSLEFIKTYRNDFFLIALSSSISVLEHNGIKSDLYFSTDGGYWAKEHLKYADTGTPLACSAESAVPNGFFYCGKIIPLSYGGTLETMLHNICGIKPIRIEHNGTVAGSAAGFALRLTDGNIFFCGLDLSSGIGFQHARPNNLSILNFAASNRIITESSGLTASRFASNGALNIYRTWFSSRSGDFSKRIFRLAQNANDFSAKLGSIKDITVNDYKKNYRSTISEKNSFERITLTESTKRIDLLFSFVKEARTGQSAKMLQKELFPALSLTAEKKGGKNEKNKLNEKYTKVLDDIENMLENLQTTIEKK